MLFLIALILVLVEAQFPSNGVDYFSDSAFPMNTTSNKLKKSRYASICCNACLEKAISSELLECFNFCAIDCRPNELCVEASNGVYAAYCQQQCFQLKMTDVNDIVSANPTPHQCRETCSSYSRRLCRNSCQDLFSNCKIDVPDCYIKTQRLCHAIS